jgi:DNA ligase-1
VSTFKPLLAETCEDIATLRYPLLVSPKLDGIRCVKLGGKALTRKLKPVKNDYVRAWVEANLPDGIDGELMLRDHRAPFSDVSSAIMKQSGEPAFVFNAFDLLDSEDAAEVPFEQRLAALATWGCNLMSSHFQVVPHVQVDTPAELQEVVDAHVALGYEGSMVRALHGRYKFGRSTVKEGILLKIKTFVDEEATVIGVVEQQHNGNEATRDALGNVKRSSAKAGKVGTGKLGALRCRLPDGTEFEIGTGFTDEQRVDLWDYEKHGKVLKLDDDRIVGFEQHACEGLLVKFKHQPPPGGRRAGEAPRFPVFLGWRDETD